MTSLWVTNKMILTHRASNLLKTWQSNSSIRRQNTLKAPRASFILPSYFKCSHPAVASLESLASPAATGSSLDVHLSLDPSCTQGPASFYSASIICLLVGFLKYWQSLALLVPQAAELSKLVVLCPKHQYLKPDEICRHELLWPSSFPISQKLPLENTWAFAPFHKSLCVV